MSVSLPSETRAASATSDSSHKAAQTMATVRRLSMAERIFSVEKVMRLWGISGN